MLLWGAVAVTMATIFYLSNQPATQSSQTSGAILVFFQKLFGSVATDFIMRKMAHFFEYAGLAFLLNWALYQHRQSRRPLLATILTSLYAFTDEIHQLFVLGRSCQLRDWAIDSAGGLLGTCVFLLLLSLHLKIKKAKRRDLPS